MPPKRPIENATELARRLKRLHGKRKRKKERVNEAGIKRRSLTESQRGEILRMTGSRCHICGGKIIDGQPWQADHVFAHAHGGQHTSDNYLPAHKLCNNYRWFYGAEEFQWILKLGVWFRTQVEHEDAQAIALAERFVKYDNHRRTRRKASGD
ncbi:MAG: HNH endonuclease [Pirellulales bacterium]